MPHVNTYRNSKKIERQMYHACVGVCVRLLRACNFPCVRAVRAGTERFWHLHVAHASRFIIAQHNTYTDTIDDNNVRRGAAVQCSRFPGAYCRRRRRRHAAVDMRRRHKGSHLRRSYAEHLRTRAGAPAAATIAKEVTTCCFSGRVLNVVTNYYRFLASARG